MKQITMFAVAAMFVCGVVFAQPPDCPWKVVTGHWRVTDESGFDAELVSKASGGNCFIGLWKTDEGKATELMGWHPETKELVSTGYGANGAYWEVVFTTVTENMIEGKMINRTPEGKMRKGIWRVTKKSKDEMATLFDGTVDGERATVKGSFKRVKK